VLLHAKKHKHYLDNGGHVGPNGDPIHIGRIKRRSM
jgi:hypothetical protein